MVTQDNINFFGEQLRNTSFIGEGIGCYNNFDVNPNYEEIMNSDIKLMYFHYFFDTYSLIFSKMDIPEYLKELKLFLNFTTNVIMGYHWDGDGTLFFQTPHYKIINTDCKIINNWRQV